jgi:hypothetical protein
MERRLETMNEFRQQLSSQAITFVNRNELELIITKIEDRFDTLGQANRDRIEQLEKEYSERKGGRIWETVILTCIVSAGIMILAHLLFKF